MRMHYPFGVAFRAGGEEHHRRLFRLARHLRAARQQQMREDPELVLRRHGVAQILQIDPFDLGQPLRQMPEVALLQKLTRGKDGFHLRRGERRAHAVDPGGVVEHRRYAPAHRRAEDRRRGHRRVGQQQADDFAWLAVALKNAADAERLFQQPGIAVRLHVDVFYAGLEGAVAGAGVEEGVIERFARAHRHARFHHNMMQMLARELAPVARALCLRHRNARGGQDSQGDTGKKAAFKDARQTAERGVLRAFDAHRHHVGLRFGGDEPRAAVDFHQRAGHGNAPFREDHHRTAAVDQPHQLLDRHRPGWIERNEIDQRLHQPHIPPIADGGVNRENRSDRQEQRQQHAVEKRHMIRRDQHFSLMQRGGVAAQFHPPQQAADQT